MNKHFQNLIVTAVAFLFVVNTHAQKPQAFNGLESNLSNLYRLSNAQTRSISPENFKGEKGKGGMATTGTGAGPSRELGQGWKVSTRIPNSYLSLRTRTSTVGDSSTRMRFGVKCWEVSRSTRRISQVSSSCGSWKRGRSTRATS